MAYRPYLLPLFAEEIPDPDKFTPESPLQEESILMDILEGPMNWSLIADSVQRKYGLGMVTGANEKPLIKTSPQKNMGRDMRIILAQSGEDNFFIMEHPAQLEEFDSMEKGELHPLLARPSLFSSWYDSPSQERMQKGTGEFADNDRHTMAAFIRHVENIRSLNPSDWHLEPAKQGYLSRIRMHGILNVHEVVTKEMGDWMINTCITLSGQSSASQKTALDGAFSLHANDEREIPLRISIVPSARGMSLAVRFLQVDTLAIKSLEDLGLMPSQQTEVVKEYADRYGLWIVAGPTGSGKSTTLHALLKKSVADNEKVLSVEDPAETRLAGVQQVQVHPDKGMTFATALRAFLRQAPDCIMIGEIRDEETAELAIQAAFTGHRVMTTVHAGDDVGIAMRFEDLNQPVEYLHSAKSITIHQRLIPVLCPKCRQIAKPSGLAREWLKENRIAAIAHPGECAECQNGYKGRSGIFSIGRFNPERRVIEDFRMQVIVKLTALETDLFHAVPFLCPDERVYFSFHNCKDFAN